MELAQLVLFLGAMIGIFYFMIVRPQKRQRDEHARLVESLAEGDEIMTRAGIYGTIKRIGDQDFELEVSRGTRLRMHKGAVANKVTREGQEQPEGPAS